MSRSVNVGLVGVGNCTSSLVQGIAYYAARPDDTSGLAQRRCADIDIADIRFTSAFDVHTGKIGRDLSGATGAPAEPAG